MPAAQAEKPTAFKHCINEALIDRMSASIAIAHPGFDPRSFRKTKSHLASLELKDRVRLVRRALFDLLPPRYDEALAVLVASAEHGTLKGFDLWPYLDFIHAHGLASFDASMEAMRRLTRHFTAEFAVRPFLIAEPERAFARLATWTRDPDEHVRRWVSEGTRPRLPWGERLGASVRDPSAGLELLGALKFDDSLYVRKSVANHLNDVAKDHPAVVVRTLKAWQKQASPADRAKIEWIKGRALRTLVKNGDPAALALLGAKSGASVRLESLKLDKARLRFPDTLEFVVEIASTSPRKQKVVIDYVIHHRRANASTAPKVFKLKTLELGPKQVLVVRKRHALKPITTRKYYAGEHHLEVQVNGAILGRASWHLKI